MSDLLKSERDCLCGLGLLASTYIHFDPALVGDKSTGHAYGYNVNCLVVDNTDGEVIALERNRIFADANPLQHAEQLGVRAALARLHQKRPRALGVSVASYLRDSLFMQKGTEPEDFLNKGCTLYNTYDPCAMCATTLVFCKMKRIAYLFEDLHFEKVYDQMRALLPLDSVKEPLALVADDDSPLGRGSVLIRRLRETVTRLSQPKGGVPLVTALDQAECRNDLEQATRLLIQMDESHLRTEGEERACNKRTLQGIKRLCNIN
jgi:tRNA(Arg) A34 adenosine deaminase TadA